MSIWSSLKTYKANWEVVTSRTFSEEEASVVKEVRVVESNYGKSIMFFIPNVGKKYIPLEETCPLEVGDTPKITDLKLLKLKYSGSTPEKMKVTETIKVRYAPKEEEPKEASFDNPFGI